jgi:hypothetical protein
VRARAKYRSPEVWAEVRERYLAGVPAPQLALEFDVGLRNIHHKAMAEGWTRKHQSRLQVEPNVRWVTRQPGEPVLRPAERAVTDFRATWPEVWDALEEMAGMAAECALSDHPEEAWPLCEWAMRWRAETFGPDCATADRERAAARATAGRQLGLPLGQGVEARQPG